METMFQLPRYKLLPDLKGRRMYGNIDNRLEFTRGDQVVHVCIAVPTGLFSVMRDIVKVPPEKNVHLAIDQVGARYVLSMMVGEDKLYDLWSYSAATLPAWMLNPRYHM